MISFCMGIKQRTLVLLCFIFLLLLSLVFLDSIYANTTHKVLIIDSLDYDSYKSQKIRCSIEKVFEQNSILYFYEFLETNELNNYNLNKTVVDYYKDKYKNYIINAVICCGNHAVNFTIKNKFLFLNTPKIICAINDSELIKLAKESGYYGSGEIYDIESTTKLIIKFSKNLKRIVYFTDKQSIFNSYQIQISKIKSKYIDKIQFVDFFYIYQIQLFETINSLTKNDAICYIGSNPNIIRSIYFSNKTLYKKLKKIPIYTVFDFPPDSGFLGASIITCQLQGQNAANIAVKIINKNYTNNLIPANSKIDLFDYNQLQNFGIKKSDIAHNSIVHNKKDKIFKNKTSLAFIALLILFIIVFSIKLAVKNKKIAYDKNNEIFSEKDTSLGRISAGIAHEIQNPLSTINVYLSTLRQFIKKKDQIHDNLDNIGIVIDEIYSASRKIESIIKRMLDFARPGKMNFVTTDIEKCIKDSISIILVTLRKKEISIETIISENLPLIKADCSALSQVLLNLITNAAEAVKQNKSSKKITIYVKYENNNICISICDNGPGIILSEQKKIFKPYYTTKKNGSGIGLCISQRIIKDHGGKLEYFPLKPEGSEFRIKLVTTKFKQDTVF